jgi:hypothetical protein
VRLSRLLAGCAAAAGLFLALPMESTAVDFYSRSTNCTTGTRQDATGVVFRDFASNSDARSAILAQTGWSAGSAGSLHLNTGTTCAGEDSWITSNTATNDPRYRMRLWHGDGVTVGTPLHEHKVSCGWVADSTGGYNDGRNTLKGDFADTYPKQSVAWGNSAFLTQCNGSSVQSNGDVAIIREKDDFGFNDLYGRADLDPLTDFTPLLEDLKATTARMTLTWNSIPTQSFTGFDDQYRDLTTGTGIRPIIILTGVPSADAVAVCHDNDPMDPPATQSVRLDKLSDYTSFVSQVVTHYYGTSQGFDQKPLGLEIWNEPNSAHFWGNCDTVNEEDHYAQVFEAAVAGVAASGQSGVKLILGGPAPHGSTSADGTKVQWTTWENGVLAYLQSHDGSSWESANIGAIGIHPYRNLPQQTAGKSFDQAATDQYDTATGLLTGTPVWVTEVGTSTTGTSTDPVWVSSDSAQADADKAIYDALRNDGARVVVMHRLLDDHSDETSHEAGWGVLDNQGGPIECRSSYYKLAHERGLLLPGDDSPNCP